MSPPLVLASASPRRRALLHSLGLEFSVVPANVPEVPAPGEPARDYVCRLAYAKARAVARLQPHAVVLGADTEVELDGAILGKPRSEADAVALLRRLSGRTHRVYTGVCLLRGDTVLARFAVESAVTFRELTDEGIRQYVATGEPMDKAGAYGAQGRGAALIAAVHGSMSNVIGLPVEHVAACLQQHGLFLDAAGHAMGK